MATSTRTKSTADTSGTPDASSPASGVPEGTTHVQVLANGELVYTDSPVGTQHYSEKAGATLPVVNVFEYVPEDDEDA